MVFSRFLSLLRKHQALRKTWAESWKGILLNEGVIWMHEDRKLKNIFLGGMVDFGGPGHSGTPSGGMALYHSKMV
jgi:hypothetical protein